MPREKMVQVGFRFPEGLVERLDVLVEQANRAERGRTISRADLVRGFLIEAFDLAEARGRGEEAGELRSREAGKKAKRRAS